MNTRHWHESLWADAYARAIGDATPRTLVESYPLFGGPVELVSWGKFKGRLCWSGFSTRTTPMTFIVEDFRVDAERKLSAANR